MSSESVTPASLSVARHSYASSINSSDCATFSYIRPFETFDMISQKTRRTEEGREKDANLSKLNFMGVCNIKITSVNNTYWIIYRTAGSRHEH